MESSPLDKTQVIAKLDNGKLHTKYEKPKTQPLQTQTTKQVKAPEKESKPEKAKTGKTKATKEPKTKKPPKEKPAPAKFSLPCEIRINDYGFIGVRKPLLEALSWHKGMTLQLTRNEDGSVTLRP